MGDTDDDREVAAYEVCDGDNNYNDVLNDTDNTVDNSMVQTTQTQPKQIAINSSLDFCQTDNNIPIEQAVITDMSQLQFGRQEDRGQGTIVRLNPRNRSYVGTQSHGPKSSNTTTYDRIGRDSNYYNDVDDVNEDRNDSGFVYRIFFCYVIVFIVQPNEYYS